MLPLSEVFGALSVFMMVCSRANYFRSIFQGKTKPHAFSWLIWGVISSIGFFAQTAEGAGAGAWARGFSAFTCFMLTVVALMRDGRGDIKRGDWITLAVSLFAIPLWMITKTPVWSVILVTLIDNIGYYPTVRKSWDKPRQEALASYFLSSSGAFFSLLAIEHYSVSTWLYPASLVLSNGGMGVFLIIRRRFTKS
jgi:hypothetical protein